MKLTHRLKLLASYLSRKPIEKGIGVSCDDSVSLPADTNISELHPKKSSYGTFYVLKDFKGSFELIGLVKNGSTALYQIRHVESGETLNISHKMLKFFFQKVK